MTDFFHEIVTNYHLFYSNNNMNGRRRRDIQRAMEIIGNRQRFRHHLYLFKKPPLLQKI